MWLLRFGKKFLIMMSNLFECLLESCLLPLNFLQAKRQKLIAKYRFEGKVCMPEIKLCKVSVHLASFTKFETDNLKQLQLFVFLNFARACGKLFKTSFKAKRVWSLFLLHGQVICYSSNCQFYQDPDDLPFEKDEILTLIRKDEEQWWTAQNSRGQTGLVPVPYVVRVSIKVY